MTRDAGGGVVRDAGNVADDGGRGRVDAGGLDSGASRDGGGMMSMGRGPLESCSGTIPCATGLRCALEFARPFCIASCATSATCPSGTTCADNRCTPTCRTGARDCDRFGAACLVQTGTSFCIPACDAANASFTCASPLACDASLGQCMSSVTTTGRDIGEPCAEDAECRSNICFKEMDMSGPTGWLGGYCIGTARFGGATTSGTPPAYGCPAGSAAFQSTTVAVGDVALCLKTCSRATERTDCRGGYGCAIASGATRGWCLPTDCSAAGSSCPAGSSCQRIGDHYACGACTPHCDGRSCGDDGCGGSCGTCGTNMMCNASFACECVPEMERDLCVAAGATCGALTTTDRCGRTRSIASCGSCSSPAMCSANRCMCPGQSDAELCTLYGATCGTVRAVDRCGTSRTIECGSCTAPQTCGGGGRTNQCGCTPETTSVLCAARGATCGTVTVTDSCGTSRTVSCGSCTSPQTCGGAGTENVCGCTAESDVAFCTRLAKNCGSVTAADNCGRSRTVTCGTCSTLETCGGGSPAVPNVCGGRSEPMTPVCTPSGFCWENPLPQGSQLNDVSTTSSGDNWVAGHSGTVLHWNGATWRGWAELTAGDLRGIWARTSSDVWVVGEAGKIMHFDGSSWTTVASPTVRDLHDVYGFAANDVWAVGDFGTLLHWNGAGWSVIAMPMGFVTQNLRALGGTSANDVWAVGDFAILHYDGSAWSGRSAPRRLTSVWSANTANAWAVGPDGMMRWTGASWVEATGARGNVVFGTSPTEVWVSGTLSDTYRFDGVSWTSAPIESSSGYVVAVRGLSGNAGELLAVAETGQLARRSRGVWTTVSKGILGRSAGYSLYLTSLVAGGTSSVAMFGSRSTGFSSYGEALVRGESVPWREIVASSTLTAGGAHAGELWGAGSGSVYRVTAGTIPTVGNRQTLTDVAPLSATDGFGVYRDDTYRLVSGTWTVVPNPVSSTSVRLNTIDAASASAAWAGGSGGTILRWDGTAWSATPTGVAGDVYMISVPDESFAMAGGSFGVLRWTGSAWGSTGLDGATLTGLAATSSTRAYAVTSAGLTQWDGTSWGAPILTTITRRSLLMYVATSGDRVWVATSSGGVLSR